VHPPRAGFGNPRGIPLPSAQNASGNRVNITKMIRRRGDLLSQEWHGPETMPQQADVYDIFRSSADIGEASLLSLVSIGKDNEVTSSFNW
jgi:hypothetical protein